MATYNTGNQTVDFIASHETFHANAYNDNGTAKIGFGSTTYNIGSWQFATGAFNTTTVSSALTNLSQSISGVQAKIASAIGANLWSALTPDQQTALTDFAYQYGGLTDDLAAAVQSGNAANVAAVLQLRGQQDASGAYSTRRDDEAALYAGKVASTTSANQVTGDVSGGAIQSDANQGVTQIASDQGSAATDTSTDASSGAASSSGGAIRWVILIVLFAGVFAGVEIFVRRKARKKK